MGEMKGQKKNGSFSRFLLLSNSALVLVPLLTLGSLVLLFVGAHFKRETTNTVRSIMASVAAESARYIEDTRRVVDYLAVQFSAFDGTLSEVDKKTLETAQMASREIRSIVVLDADLRVAASMPPQRESLGMDYSRRPFIKDIREGGTILSIPFVNPETETVNVAVAKKLKRSVIVAYLDLRALSGFLQDLRYAQPDEVALVDETGAFIAHTDYRRVIERSRDSRFAQLRAIAGKTLQRSESESRIFMAAGMPVSASPWTVLYYRDVEDAYLLIRDLAIQFLIALVALTAMAAALTLILHQAISDRLRVLVSHVEEMQAGSGEPIPRYEDDRWREFRNIGRSFTEMAVRIREREDALRKSEDQYRNLFLNNKAATLIIDAEDGRVMDANPAALAYYRYEDHELRGMALRELATASEGESLEAMVAAADGQRSLCRMKTLRRGGEVRDVEAYASPVEWNGRRCFYAIFIDTTERRIAEEKLAHSLAEKNVLLKEIHHRVKNNMQIMLSLLSLQSKYVKSKEDEALFTSSQNRIRTMALIHELIYQREDLSLVDLKDYARSLCAFFEEAAQEAGAAILLDCVSVATTPEIALPFGLILDELLANSLKSAFPSGRPDPASAVIKVRLRQAEETDSYELSYNDNGVGLPEGVDPAQAQSLGFLLVNTVSMQLGAKVEYRTERPGFGASVNFRIPRKGEGQEPSRAGE